MYATNRSFFFTEREGYTRPSRLQENLGSGRNKIVFFQFYALANRPHAFTSEIRIGVRFCGVVINVRFGLSSCGKGDSLSIEPVDGVPILIDPSVDYERGLVPRFAYISWTRTWDTGKPIRG